MKNLKEKAEDNNMTQREYCITQIKKWKVKLQDVSTDYRRLTDEEFEKKIDEEFEELDERKSNSESN